MYAKSGSLEHCQIKAEQKGKTLFSAKIKANKRNKVTRATKKNSKNPCISSLEQLLYVYCQINSKNPCICSLGQLLYVICQIKAEHFWKNLKLNCSRPWSSFCKKWTKPVFGKKWTRPVGNARICSLGHKIKAEHFWKNLKLNCSNKQTNKYPSISRLPLF